MKKLLPLLILLILPLACNSPLPAGSWTPTAPVDISTPATPVVMADSFYSGYAYLDANADAILDETDPPLEGIYCTATDADGIGSGALTDSSGYAMIWWPSGSTYPITVRCVPMKDSAYTLIGPEEVILQMDGTGGPAKFLFAAPPAGASEKRCGDGVCDGPETAATCPQDCGGATGTPESLSPLVTPGAETGVYWVTNPTSGARLFVQVLGPSNRQGDALPTLVLVPGGIGASEAQKAQRLADSGFTVVIFDADGRGQSEGVEDYNGFIQQDGLAAVIRAAAALPRIDAARIGLVSYSYGITMASGTLARYPDLPIRFLIDWEGPSDRNATTTGCTGRTNNIEWQPCTDEAFWAEREAASFIGKLTVPYQRIQSEVDHVQPNNDHAITMINAAIQGGVPWVRLNDYEPNQTYDFENPPAMIPEENDKRLEEMIARYVLELLAIP